MIFDRKYALANGETIKIRLAGISDSKDIINVWNEVVKERVYTMGLQTINEEEEIKFINNLDEREAILIVLLNEKIIGYLLILIPEKQCKSTLHVAEIGTWILRDYRNLGIGHFLLISAFEFMKLNNFEKIIIKVRSSNQGAFNFYKEHGFNEIGRFKKQLKIDGKYDDHILMEKFLND